MQTSDIDRIKRRVQERRKAQQVEKPVEAPRAPRNATIWVAPKVTRAKVIRSATTISTPILAAAIALYSAAQFGLI